MTEKIFYPNQEDYQELEDEIVDSKFPDWVEKEYWPFIQPAPPSPPYNPWWEWYQKSSSYEPQITWTSTDIKVRPGEIYCQDSNPRRE